MKAEGFRPNMRTWPDVVTERSLRLHAEAEWATARSLITQMEAMVARADAELDREPEGTWLERTEALLREAAKPVRETPHPRSITTMVSQAVEVLGYRCQMAAPGIVMLTKQGEHIVDHGGTAALIGARMIGLGAVTP